MNETDADLSFLSIDSHEDNPASPILSRRQSNSILEELEIAKEEKLISTMSQAELSQYLDKNLKKQTSIYDDLQTKLKAQKKGWSKELNSGYASLETLRKLHAKAMAQKEKYEEKVAFYKETVEQIKDSIPVIKTTSANAIHASVCLEYEIQNLNCQVMEVDVKESELEQELFQLEAFNEEEISSLKLQIENQKTLQHELEHQLGSLSKDIGKLLSLDHPNSIAERKRKLNLCKGRLEALTEKMKHVDDSPPRTSLSKAELELWEQCAKDLREKRDSLKATVQSEIDFKGKLLEELALHAKLTCAQKI